MRYRLCRSSVNLSTAADADVCLDVSHWVSRALFTGSISDALAIAGKAAGSPERFSCHWRVSVDVRGIFQVAHEKGVDHCLSGAGAAAGVECGWMPDHDPTSRVLNKATPFPLKTCGPDLCGNRNITFRVRITGRKRGGSPRG